MMDDVVRFIGSNWIFDRWAFGIVFFSENRVDYSEFQY